MTLGYRVARRLAISKASRDVSACQRGFGTRRRWARRAPRRYHERMSLFDGTEPIDVDAWMDFCCPYSFITSLALRRLRDELPLAVHWRSVLVRPPGLPPLSGEMR